MPFQDSNSRFPLIWSSKRTIQCMRRLGITEPIDDALIDQAATDFVNNCIEKAPITRDQGDAIGIRQHSGNVPAVNAGSLVAGSPKATCRSNSDGPMVCEDENSLEGPTLQGVILHADDVTLAKGSVAAHETAMSLNQRVISQFPVGTYDNVRVTKTQATLEHDNMTEILGKKETGDAIKLTEVPEHDNGSYHELVQHRKFGERKAVKSMMDEMGEKHKRAEKIASEFQDNGYGAETEGYSLAEEIPVTGNEPLLSDAMKDLNAKNNNWPYSNSMDGKSAAPFVQSVEKPEFKVKQMEMVAPEIPPREQTSERIDGTEGTGEGSA